MPDIFGELARDWDRVEHIVRDQPVGGWFGRREDPYAASQTPAAQPVNVRATAPQEDPLSLSSIASDIKDAVENGDQWLKQIAETHLPAILATAAKYESPTAARIAETLAGRVLPQPYEDMAVAVLEALFDKHGTTTPVEQPQQPAAA